MHWEDRYVAAGYGLPGDRIVLKFPIAGRTVKDTIGNVPYTLVIKGNTVVSIDPPGKIGPLYERAYYRTHRAPLRKVRRFVPGAAIEWKTRHLSGWRKRSSAVRRSLQKPVGIIQKVALKIPPDFRTTRSLIFPSCWRLKALVGPVWGSMQTISVCKGA